MNNPPSPTLTSRHLRDTLGRFATGIAVVTAREADGTPCGLTVNSFNTVSLDPPLIVWSLKLNSSHLATFQQTEHFAISILRADQEAISRQFAGPNEQRWHGIASQDTPNQVPIIANALAWLECRMFAQHEVGDHLMLIGEITHCHFSDGEPLLYFAGSYRHLVI